MYGFPINFLHGTHRCKTLVTHRQIQGNQYSYLTECGDCYAYSSMVKLLMCISNNYSSYHMFVGKEVGNLLASVVGALRILPPQ